MGADGAVSAEAPPAPSGPLYKLGPASFQQIPHASLSIDASVADLLFAFRAAVAQSDSKEARSQLHARIAQLFQSRPNVYDTAEAVAAAAERAQQPPLSAEAAADPRASRAAASFASPSAPSLPSPLNVNATLPARLIAPAYLLAEHNIHTGLSARSCLDCWLSAMQFERGSVVLLTAVNIPDISVVLRAHGLIPVPVDVEVDTLAPRMDLLEQAARDGTAADRRSGRVVAILVAQLYGRRFDMAPVAALAQRHSLRLIEDLAESFSGLDHLGHPAADLALLSFGSIKVATAFGGGIARVRDGRVWEQMQRMQEGWAVQSRQTFFSKVSTCHRDGARAGGGDFASALLHSWPSWRNCFFFLLLLFLFVTELLAYVAVARTACSTFFQRCPAHPLSLCPKHQCVKNSLAMVVLNAPPVTGGLTRSARVLNWDVKASVVSLMRGFPDRLMERLREQPCAALLAVLHRRMQRFDAQAFQTHQDKCDVSEGQLLLAPRRCEEAVGGGDAQLRTHFAGKLGLLIDSSLFLSVLLLLFPSPTLPPSPLEQLLLDLLPSAPGVVIPGVAAPVRNHWLFPVVVRHVAEVQRLLNDNGVDAYRGATQLALVPMASDADANGLVDPPAAAADMMARTLFLPMHRNVPVAAIVRMALVMHRVVERVELNHGDGDAAVQPQPQSQSQSQPIRSTL